MSAELSAILVKAGKISGDQAEKALDLAKEQQQTFQKALVSIGAIGSEDEISD